MTLFAWVRFFVGIVTEPVAIAVCLMHLIMKVLVLLIMRLSNYIKTEYLRAWLKFVRERGRGGRGSRLLGVSQVAPSS